MVAVFAKKCLSMIEGMEEMAFRARNVETGIIAADARATALPDDTFGFILNHPPYFALYKYSSDVLRFELEWARYNRRQIRRNEIRDGFKTTRLDALDEYVADMADVFAEAHRVLQPGGFLCLVVNNSTLRDVRLPVVERLTRRAESTGFTLRRHFDRAVRYAQASYHRSARADKRVNRDHILFFLK